mmetsp:Transcript_75049/g.160805  ORF Transcript_75049/g.160805 Transcript_75049/m.160805 type:complete len:340 (-) Transcript_75049:276-1295(-)
MPLWLLPLLILNESPVVKVAAQDVPPRECAAYAKSLLQLGSVRNASASTPKEDVQQPQTFVAEKSLSAVLLLIFDIVGIFSAYRIADSLPSWVQTCNAFAAGTIISVCLVHMLPDGVSELSDVGKALAARLGPDRGVDKGVVFPIAYSLVVAGFLVNMCIHAVGEDVAHEKGRESGGDAQSSDTSCAHQQSGASPFTSVGALLGLSLHSFVEAVAVGTQTGRILLMMTVAICAHKGFEAFALGQALLPLIQHQMAHSWWGAVVGFCLTTPLGIAVGALAATTIDGPAVAALNCFAAGTLLFVGIVEIMLPAFAVPGDLCRNLLALTFSAFVTALLAMWA